MLADYDQMLLVARYHIPWLKASVEVAHQAFSPAVFDMNVDICPAMLGDVLLDVINNFKRPCFV
jgi:hypothetical protein